MLHRSKSREHTRSLTTPSPSYMSKDQVADYLSDLRSNRVPRPRGSRPLPNGIPTRDGLSLPVPGEMSSSRIPTSSTRNSSGSNDLAAVNASGDMFPPRTDPEPGSYQTLSNPKTRSSGAGRPIARLPSLTESQADVPRTLVGSELRPSGTYRESGQRWMERQEARSLRAALQDMDVQEEARLHAAAQAEASDLVWRHQNEGRPYDYPNAPQKYKEHLRKGSHERYQMTGGCSTTNSANGLARPRDHSSRDRNNALQASRSGSVGERTSANRTSSLTGAGGMSQGPDPSRSHTRKVHELWDSPQKKAYMSLTDPIPLAHPRKSSGSNGRKTSANSNQGLFSNPDDQIYEEPEVALERPPHANGQMPEAPRPLRVRARNSLGRVMETTPKIDKELPALVGKLSLYDIHRNPPTQTRDPNYVTNEPPAIMLDSRDEDDVDAHDHALAMKDGKEVRSQEIRSATTMRLKDRSPKLPAPTFVSDSPDRPIVSFDPSWQPKDEVSESESKRTSQKFYAGRTSDMTKSRPLSSSSKECYRKMNSVIHDHNDADSRRSDSSPDGSIPVIEVSSNPSTKQEGAFTSVIPSINVSNGPSISINALPDSQPLTPSPLSDTKTCSRPLPTPGKGPARPLPRYRLEGGTATPQTDLRPSTKMHAASCTQCGLGIAGRIVSAAGQRFHPECFACYNCGEELECVAFYPEPENKRAERNERIQMRVQGMEVEEQDGQGELEDGDPCPRFYCHLDFHELFSPRCKSCKTPIEGEIIVACGAEWHVGHFFCAQCGDPFDASTPFVEKDGYAWCLNCHTNRFSTKCKKCRKPVTDMVLKALGSEWHTDCFCCTECGGAFDNGQYFLRGNTENPVCLHCEEKRLKA